MDPSDKIVLPNSTTELPFIIDNLIMKVSNSSILSSQVTDILALPSVAPVLIVILNGFEL